MTDNEEERAVSFRAQARRPDSKYQRSSLEFVFTRSQQVGAMIFVILYFQYFVYRTERLMDSYLIQHSFLQELREAVAPSLDKTHETRYLVFQHVEDGQGLGNSMNGLLAVQMLGLEFNRTVCVDRDWVEFHQAFHELQHEVCHGLSLRESIESTRTLQFFNFNKPPNECDLKMALASNIEVIYIITNTYPRWAEVPTGLWDDNYEPTSDLIDTLPYTHRPSMVVHLRYGDDETDVRKGLDNATFHALGKILPNNTFLVTNNVQWYNLFESLYGWNHPNWRRISHSALFIGWPSTNNKAVTPMNMSTTELANLQLFSDWYTILMADKVYHTHSDFSLSAIHWNSIESKTIQGVSPSKELQLSDESWRLEGAKSRLVDRSGEELDHCDSGPVPSGDEFSENDFFDGRFIMDDQYNGDDVARVKLAREPIERTYPNRVNDDSLDAFVLPDEENPFRLENLLSQKRRSSIPKHGDNQGFVDNQDFVDNGMSSRFQREKPPDWLDDIAANQMDPDDDFNDV